MRSRTVEKLLYKAAILLVIVGAFIKFILAPDSDSGLYMILAGHVVGVACILAYMKHACNKERRNEIQHQRDKLTHYKNS